MMMTRPGLPFDHDKYDYIDLRDYRVGMELQVDDGWESTLFEPWSIKTVLQTADGRLYVESKDGAPVLLADLAAELDPDNTSIWGMFYVPLDGPSTLGTGNGVMSCSH